MSSKLKNITRYLAFGIELIIFAVIQQLPGVMPSVFGERPVLILAAVITISLFEGVFPSIIIGVIGGLFMDIASGGVFGFYGLILALISFFTSTVCTSFIKVNFWTALITGGICVFAAVFSDWFFLFLLKGYEYPAYAFLLHYLPRMIYTFIFVPIAYILNRSLALALQAGGKIK